MVNKHYLAGSNFERRVKKYLEDKDFYVARTAGSHGSFDLIAIPRNNVSEILLIQCKIRSPLKKEYDKLKEAKFGFTDRQRFKFIMSYKIKGKLKFELLEKEYSEIEL